MEYEEEESFLNDNEEEKIDESDYDYNDAQVL